MLNLRVQFLSVSISIQPVDWPARSLNLIEHMCETLGRRWSTTANNHFRAAISAKRRIFSSLSRYNDNFVFSMDKRYKSGAAFKSNHTPYQRLGLSYQSRGGFGLLSNCPS
ncbi:hypothetical protein TNCV_4661501 [Trichonephila clavipes]|uniref:Uncharacterized protein n=1 Tax=Trichonephila clavipes TaxID=2585209 RepID=A0A8X6VDU3_TRICX|nr:hypothetical protein TNCV_4661501 [Trichonephila clavipes]